MNQTWHQLSPRLKVGMGIVCGLLILKYAFFPYLDWQHQGMQRAVGLKEAIARKKSLMGREDEISIRLIKLRGLHEQLDSRFEDQVTDPKTMQLALQKEVENLAQTLKAQIINIDWLPVVPGNIIAASVKFRIEIIPENFLRLIQALENGNRFRYINPIQVIARSNSEQLAADLTITAYGLSAERQNS